MAKAAAFYVVAAFGSLVAAWKHLPRLQDLLVDWAGESAKPSLSRHERHELRMQTVDGWFMRSNENERAPAYIGKVRMMGNSAPRRAKRSQSLRPAPASPWTR